MFSMYSHTAYSSVSRDRVPVICEAASMPLREMHWSKGERQGQCEGGDWEQTNKEQQKEKPLALRLMCGEVFYDSSFGRIVFKSFLCAVLY